MGLWRLGLAARHGHHCLQDFVHGESETELRRRSENTSGTTLEESRESFLLPDGLGGVAQTSVLSFTLAGLDLQTRLDDIARCREVSSGHTGNGTSSQELNDTQLLSGRLAEEVLLEMVIRGEVDGGEGNVAQQASRSSLVQTNETQVAHNPHGRSFRGAFDGLGDFSLHLQANLDDFEGVSKDLRLLVE